MKTKLLFALSLLLSFITSAQRIDYALNHQDGINIVSPIQLRVVSDNIFLVSYKGIDEDRSTSFYISVIASDGRVLSTNRLQEAGPNDYLNFDITPTGTNLWYTSTLSFGSNPSYSTCQVYASSYDSRFGSGHIFYDYHKDSITSFYLATNAERFALIDKKEYTKSQLQVGHLIKGKDVKETALINLDSIPAYWGYSPTWLNDKSLYLNGISNAVIYHFGDSNNLVSQESILKCERPILFKNQLFDLKNNFTWDDTITSMLLRNSAGTTIRYLDCKEAWQPYGKLLSTPQNLISIHQQSQFIGNVKYDSLIVNYFDTALNHTHRVAVASGFWVRAVEVDSVSGQLVFYGRNNKELILIVVNKNGVVSAVNEISKQFKLSAYPNPVNQTLNLNLMNQAKTINVYTSVGQLVLSTKAVSKLDVSAWTNGLYMIEVLDEINQRIAITRILKQ